MCRELPQLGEENILEEIVIVMVIEDHLETKDPLEEEDTLVEDHLIEEDNPNRGGRPPDRGGYPGGGTLIKAEGPLEEDILMEVGDPLEEEDTLVEDPLMEEEGP